MDQKRWFYIDHNRKKTFWEHPGEQQFRDMFFRNLQTRHQSLPVTSGPLIHQYQTSGDSGAFEGARLSSREDDSNFGASESDFYQQNQLNSNFQNCTLRQDVVVKSELLVSKRMNLLFLILFTSFRNFLSVSQPFSQTSSSSTIRNTIVTPILTNDIVKNENDQRTSPARPSALSFDNGSQEHFMSDGMSTLTPGLTGLTPGPNSELPSDILEFLLSNQN